MTDLGAGWAVQSIRVLLVRQGCMGQLSRGPHDGASGGLCRKKGGFGYKPVADDRVTGNY